MRKPGKHKPKSDKPSAAQKHRPPSYKEEGQQPNEEVEKDLSGIKNLGGDDFDRKFENMLV